MLFRFDLAGAQLAVFAHPIAHGVDRAIQEALGGKVGVAGKVVERQQAWLLQIGAVAAPQHASLLPPLQCLSERHSA